jgi:hypothetical protein
MNTFAKGLGAMVGLVAVLFVSIIATTFLGAITGAVVGLFFSNAIVSTFSAFGVTGLSMWKLGATLGFVGSFFKTYSMNKKEE